MSRELGDTLYISLPTVNEEWVEEHAVELWVGGVARFRAIAAGSWGDAFEKHFCGFARRAACAFSMRYRICAMPSR